MKREYVVNQNTGMFVVSLDFELQYGIEDMSYVDTYKQNILGGRNTIKEILNLFN